MGELDREGKERGGRERLRVWWRGGERDRGEIGLVRERGREMRRESEGEGRIRETVD